ncbi:cdc42 effector protein 4 [Eucyclogobius newberryi]|uniref:cdc42 effector protein 4 n=1 Tax=Eucyclogobius newberryi TaxID=166745 RepID=UPI003B5B77B1
MPILKQLVSNSQSKRRSRIDLTPEMISAPMGDFRHTMHVGRGGDAFGDTSFLSTRSGEPPREQETTQVYPASKPSLLSRTFRSSKRTQSVNRADNYNMAPNNGSAPYVKNAISLPYLNEDVGHNGAHRMPKSVSSSPMKRLSEIETKPPANGAAAAMATLDAEFDERNFGELTDLPPPKPKPTGMKHAESMMSFHIDLGPSMLDDILGVMEKKAWEDADDLGFEEDKVSDGRASPSSIPHIDDDDAEVRAPTRPPRSIDNYAHEIQARNGMDDRDDHDDDSCSVSSGESVGNDKRQYIHDDTDSAKYSSPRHGEDGEFTFMDEDDDEIRV